MDLNLTYIEKVFNLAIANRSQSVVSIWSPSYSFGYYSVYFQVSPQNGKRCSIKRMPKRWTVNIPDLILIQPGEAYLQHFDLNDGTWDLSKCGSDRQTAIDIGAILEIEPDENTVTYGVITGHHESNRLHFRSVSEIVK